MRKAAAFFFIFTAGLVFWGAPHLAAQEEEAPQEGAGEENIPIEGDWDAYMPNLYSRGDQTFTISAGVTFPTLFINDGKIIKSNLEPPVGGIAHLAYNHFFGAHFNVGGEIGILFIHTLADNTLFIVPIGLRAGWQFLLGRFEFPVTLTFGLAPQSYRGLNYAGFFMKGGGAAFFRFNPDWSFGLNASWSWYPETYENKKYNVHGNFVDLVLAARYHF